MINKTNNTNNIAPTSAPIQNNSNSNSLNITALIQQPAPASRVSTHENTAATGRDPTDSQHLSLIEDQQNTAALKIQTSYRNHLLNHFPTMLHKDGTLKELPKLTHGPQNTSWGARNLRLSKIPSYAGSFAQVCTGQLGSMPIVVKNGNIDEVQHLQPLLKAQQSGIRMVIPVPMENYAASKGLAIKGQAIMPRMEQTFYDFIADKDCSSDEVATIQQDYIGDAYKLLYDHNIEHGDLHGNNVLLDKNNTPHLADFGFVTIHEEGDVPTDIRFK